MSIGKDGYYSYRDILGYYPSCRWFFVLGDRGRGKSYGAKKMLLASENKFMCLYRNVSDLELAIADWLSPMYNEGYLPEQFEWEKLGKSGGANLIMNGSVKGYFRCISQTNHIKQEYFGDTPDDYVETIFFDEFIPMVYRKIGGSGMSEGECVRVIAKTVDHDTAHPREERGMKPLKVIMVANPFTWDNPILSYFHVLPKKIGIFRVGPQIVCEMLDPYVSCKVGGKQTIDDFLGDSVNKTQGWMDENSFVGPVPKGAVPEWSMRFGDRYYGLYRVGHGAKLYCRSIGKHLNVYNKYGTLKGLQEGEMSIESKRGSSHKTMRAKLLQYVLDGGVQFETMNCKFDMIRDLQ